MRAWLAAWPLAALIGVANGIARERTYGRRLPERAAHQLSSATAVGAFALLFLALQRRRPLRDGAEAARVGSAWLLLTVAFEFGFGRLVARQSWEELLADYDLSEGRTWPLVLAWLGTGPALVRALAAGPSRTSARP